MSAGARALLLGAVLALVPPAPGLACEARGDRGAASQRLGVVFASPLRARPLEFDGARLGSLIELGRADGRRCLEALGYSS